MGLQLGMTNMHTEGFVQEHTFKAICSSSSDFSGGFFNALLFSLRLSTVATIKYSRIFKWTKILVIISSFCWLKNYQG